MKFQIGGDLELYLEDLMKKPLFSYKSLEKRRINIWTDTGRSAIYLALTHILRAGCSRRAWLPSYSCDSVIQPFEELGFTIQFYSVGPNLSTISKVPEQLKSRDIFLFINYFGIQNQHAIAVIEHLKQNSPEFYVIEDSVQSSISNNVGKTGDFIITSFRKFFPQPDGAMLSTDLDIEPTLADPNEHFVTQRMISKILKAAATELNPFLELLRNSEKELNKRCIPRKMSYMSEFIMARVDVDKIARLRRENWLHMHARITGNKHLLTHIQPLINQISDDEIPFGYPLLVKNGLRNALRNSLVSNKVFCNIHWPFLRDAGNPDRYLDEALANAELTLPTDDYVTRKDIDYIVNNIIDFYSSKV
jgi:dTDP-4-amino-4,6-dideoxygalactose transaminase